MIELRTTTAYSTAEIAEKLHRTPDAVRKLFQSGKLKGKKVGSSWYATEEAITYYVTGEGPEDAPEPKKSKKR